MKKILIFSLAYYPNVGGAEVAIKKITNHIKDIEFHMVTLRFSSADKKKEKNENVTVHRVGQGSGYFSKILFIPLAALEARRLQKTEKFDAVWIMMSYMLLPFLLSGLRVPYVLTLQEGDTEYHMFGRLRILPFLPLINRGFRGATVVQVISNYLGTWARKRGFVGPLEVIPNGVDVKRFLGEKIPHKGTVLITASRLVHKNGIDTVIHALPLLPNIQFVVFGTGPDEKKLLQLAQKLCVANRVDFRGFIDHARLSQELRAGDIFVRPSRSEGMGNSFIEAMAAGIPVVATREGGLADFIFDGKTAWVVEKDSPEQIARAAQDILANPEKVKKITETARAMVVAEYSWDSVARDMRQKIFGKVLG